MTAATVPSTYRECLAFLFARNQFAMKLGLENIRALLDRLGNPDRGMRFLHVAGTNGKGSVCANLAALLGACGYRRVGLYTSPHLVSFRERILIDGEPIPPDAIVEWMGRAHAAILELGATYFECVTALALDWFRRSGCEAVVLETGLGGRLDATNAVTPALTVITSISLDHTAILGDTVEAIWREKIGILKPGVPMVVREDRPRLLAELAERAGAAGSAVIRLGDHPARVVDGTWRFRGARREYAFPADLRPEEHQKENLALSLLALEAFLGGEPPPDAALLPLLREARVPGRTQLLTATGRLPLVLDGAHNPGGMEALAAWLRRDFPGRRILALFSLMRDKDVPAVVRSLRTFAVEIGYVPLGKFPRALGYGELETALASEGGAAGIREFPLEAMTLDSLLRPGPGKPDLVVACGSLYLLGELIPRLLEWYPGLEPFRQFAGES